MRQVRVTDPARRDIANVLRRSHEDFGRDARVRYRRLLDRALSDLADDPARIGVRGIDDVRRGYFAYHLRSSTKGAPRPSVRQPRHLIVFYLDDSGNVIVARVFHERQMLARHLVDDHVLS